MLFSMVQTQKQLITRDTVLFIMRVEPVLQNALNCCGRRDVPRIPRYLDDASAIHRQTVLAQQAAAETVGQKPRKYSSGFRPA